MDAEEKTLLTDSLEGIVRDTAPERLTDALAEFGWRDLLDDEPDAAVSILMEAQGRRLATARTLETVVLAAAEVDDAVPTAVAFPALPSGIPTSTAGSDGTVTIRAVVGAKETAPEYVVVPVLVDGEPGLVHTRWHGAWPTTGTGIAPESGWTQLNSMVHIGQQDLSGGADAARRWRNLRAAGHRALAHELVGTGSVMLELAVDHVSSRTQFGKPLGSFQAIKHQLADVRLWLECARLAAESAWEHVDERETAVASLLAKTIASRFSHIARAHCQQVLGGMGFTWEHDFHRYLKRALLLEPLLGAPEQLHAELGEDLQAGDLPRLALL